MTVSICHGICFRGLEEQLLLIPQRFPWPGASPQSFHGSFWFSPVCQLGAHSLLHRTVRRRGLGSDQMWAGLLA